MNSAFTRSKFIERLFRIKSLGDHLYAFKESFFLMVLMFVSNHGSFLLKSLWTTIAGFNLYFIEGCEDKGNETMAWHSSGSKRIPNQGCYISKIEKVSILRLGSKS